MFKDLVCGMMVDQKNPPAQTLYKGRMYYFCSMDCKVKFSENPEKYLEAQKKEEKDEKAED